MDKTIEKIEKEIKQKDSEEKIFDFVILTEQYSNHMGGAKLIIKQGDGNYIWRMLNYLGAK